MPLALSAALEPLLFTVGLFWVGAMARRARRDLADFRTTEDGAEKFAIVLKWAATAAIAWGCAAFVLGLVRFYRG